MHSIPNLGWPQALRLLAPVEGGSPVIDPSLLISQVFPFSAVPEAVTFAATRRSETVKVMVDVDS